VQVARGCLWRYPPLHYDQSLAWLAAHQQRAPPAAPKPQTKRPRCPRRRPRGSRACGTLTRSGSATVRPCSVLSVRPALAPAPRAHLCVPRSSRAPAAAVLPLWGCGRLLWPLGAAVGVPEAAHPLPGPGAPPAASCSLAIRRRACVRRGAGALLPQRPRPRPGLLSSSYQGSLLEGAGLDGQRPPAQGDRPAPPCLWQLRSREEAAEAWRSEFGHLEEGAEAPAAASVPASAERSATGAAEGAAGGSAGAGQGSQPMVFAVARGAALRAASAVGGPAEAARQRDLQAQQAHAGAGESRSPGT